MADGFGIDDGRIRLRKYMKSRGDLMPYMPTKKVQ